MPSPRSVTAAVLLIAAAAGCSAVSDSSEDSDITGKTAEELRGLPILDAFFGKELFDHATFGGNGRTCSTCHTEETGTISPQQIRRLAITDPHNPIFRSIDSDDGKGNDYSRLKKNATIRITLDLPPHIRLHDDPTAKKFTVNRSVPVINNTSLFPTLMWDGRQPDLPTQALSAVHDHYQERFEPTKRQLDLIASYERTQFTNPRIASFARGGPAPALPTGRTASEKRGRAFFDPSTGACGSCHSGPLLNVSNENNPLSTEPHFNTNFAGFEQALGFAQAPDAPNPVRMWDLDCPASDATNGGAFCGFLCPVFGGGTVTDNVCTLPMPDPGEAIANGDVTDFLFFKTPSLWGVNETAPYFHDNSASSLKEVLAHYDKFFQFLFSFGISKQNGLSSEEQQDIISFLKLL